MISTAQDNSSHLFVPQIFLIPPSPSPFQPPPFAFRHNRFALLSVSLRSGHIALTSRLTLSTLYLFHSLNYSFFVFFYWLVVYISSYQFG